MRVLVAMDSFKGSLGSREAGEAVRSGVLAVAPDAEVTVVPVADGGEGLLEALADQVEHAVVHHDAVDAVGGPLESRYLRLRDGRVVLESATTLGLTHMAQLGMLDDELPARASSRGLGVAVRHALDHRATGVLIGLGGSACTDGGTGLLLELGARLWDGAGRGILAQPGVNPLLASPVRVELPDPSRVPGHLVSGLVDVRSPLLGPAGAAHLFGPQKGATAGRVVELEDRMSRWAEALADAGVDVADEPGAGAAGGLGAAILALGGRLVDGFATVASEVGLADHARGVDLVLTGEGSFDAQTALGKVPDGVARLTRSVGVGIVVALAGQVTSAGVREDGAISPVDVAMPIHSRPRSLAEAMDADVTRAELAATAARIVTLIRAAR